MAESGIYEIVNLRNGKRYVGSAVNFESRWREHRRQLRKGIHHSRHLQRAWLKHGEVAFEFRRLLECGRAELIENEQAAIGRLDPEYNISRTAGSTLGVRYTAESRARISASRMGKRKGEKQSPEHVEKRAAQHRGKKRSEETRRKIAEKARGRKFVRFNDDYRAKLSAAGKGRMPTPGHMEKLQAARAAHVDTPEQKAAKSEGLKRAYAEGRKSRERSPEYRAKIAETLRRRAQDPAVREQLRQQALDAAARKRAASE